MGSIPEDKQELLRALERAASKEDKTSARVRLPNGQLARLTFKLDVDYGYRRAKLSLETPRVEKAIVAALAALNGKWVKPHRVRRAIHSWEWSQEALRSRITDGSFPEPPPETNREIKNATAGDVSAGFSLSYVQDLLRHYRPGFDAMPKDEQTALITRVVEHTNEFLEALRKLSVCLEYGHATDGLPTSPVKEAAKDARAAELRDIDELTYKEIGKRLGVKPYKKDRERNDNTPVRTLCVPKGREVLKRALGVGDAGYKEYVRARKAEAQHWRALSESWRVAESFAEGTGITPEQLHHLMACSEEDLLTEVSELDEDQRDDVAWARAAWEWLSDKERRTHTPNNS